MRRDCRFLTKPFGDDVCDAIRHASSAASLHLITSEMRALRDCHASLSRRDGRSSLVVTGLLNKQVGGELGISEITVKALEAR